jgi:UDP-N-acetylglucosamine 2-epimerase (non-hydrolysing)
MVVGDVNSTVACALVCSKLGIKVAHVEAGLRSFDRKMPEEINRVLTDAISDLLLTTEEDAADNLLREGIGEDKIRFVGNVMIDSLFANLERAKASDIRDRLSVTENEYSVLTMHRPSNVDDARTLEGLIDAFVDISVKLPVIFPVHPRTKAKIAAFGLSEKINASGIRLIEPLGYLDFLRLYSGARFVLTDSGGLQEETTALGIPCLTIRENTERPITIALGTNTLVGTDPERIGDAVSNVLISDRTDTKIPPLWDGKAAERICDELLSFAKSF